MQPEIPDRDIRSLGDPTRPTLPQAPRAVRATDLNGRDFWGPDASVSSIRDNAIPYWHSNYRHRDRDAFSRDVVLPWLKGEFPSVTTAQVALDLACNCGISAVALATSGAFTKYFPRSLFKRRGDLQYIADVPVVKFDERPSSLS